MKIKGIQALSVLDGLSQPPSLSPHALRLKTEFVGFDLTNFGSMCTGRTLRPSNFAMISPFFTKNIPINIPKNNNFYNFGSVCTGRTFRPSNFTMISPFFPQNIPINIPKNNKFYNIGSVCTGRTLRPSNFAMISPFFPL
jgi:hypothetical protein